MTLASSINSSSDMEPSLIILMATLYWPLHFPYFTTPNCPVPSSFRKVRSLGSISHDPRTECECNVGAGYLPAWCSQSSSLANPRKADKHLLPEKSATKSTKLETCSSRGWEQGSLWNLLINTVTRGQLGSDSWEGLSCGRARIPAWDSCCQQGQTLQPGKGKIAQAGLP